MHVSLRKTYNHAGKPKTEYLYVYCHCCKPHDGEERMAQCKEWYHESCKNIGPQAVFKDDSNDWKCNMCIAGEKQTVCLVDKHP